MDQIIKHQPKGEIYLLPIRSVGVKILKKEGLSLGRRLLRMLSKR